MDFVSCEKDVNDLSDKIWGKHWKFIINGKNVREIKPFNMNDLKLSKKYNVQTFGPIDPDDEKKILNWISESDPEDDSTNSFSWTIIILTLQ